MYKNEAAERLRLILIADENRDLIDAALAEERRHVIEQIKADLIPNDPLSSGTIALIHQRLDRLVDSD